MARVKGYEFESETPDQVVQIERKIIDREDLMSRLQGDRDLLDEISRIFSERTPLVFIRFKKSCGGGRCDGSQGDRSQAEGRRR